MSASFQVLPNTSFTHSPIIQCWQCHIITDKRNSHVSCVLHDRSYHTPGFHDLSNIWWILKITILSIMAFPPLPPPPIERMVIYKKGKLIAICLLQHFKQSLSLSLFILLLPLRSLGHPWNALFHFSFLIWRQSVGLPGRGISPSQGRHLHRTTQTQNNRRHTSMPWVGFDPSIPVFKEVKTVHALHRAAIVIGQAICSVWYLWI
jgi:hypothetical protein